MTARPLILVVDDEAQVRDSLRALLEMSGYRVTEFSSAEACLDAAVPEAQCLISDIRMPGLDGLALQAELARRGIAIPLIFMTGHGDVSLAVRGLQAGALEFLEKPCDAAILLDAVARAVAAGAQAGKARKIQSQAQAQLALLSPREHMVFDELVAGYSSKVIAHHLGLSPRTVEVHRSNIKRKLKAGGLADLTRIACAAPGNA